MKQARELAARLALATSIAATATVAEAGKKFEADENTWISVGAGVRLGYRGTEDAGSESGDWGRDYETESFRIYLNGQLNDWLGFTLNTEKDGSNDDWIRLLDAIVRMEFNDYFNIWAGRMLAPSDRSNFDGPYYLGIWDFPLVQAYPAVFAGRDDGVAVWGQTGGGQFKYQFGVFEGCRDSAPCAEGSNDPDGFLYTGRLTFNFWDPEPGYYNSSDYYGDKEILAIGLVAQHQSDATGVPGASGDFTGTSIDFLMQNKLENDGVFTVESAYYSYDLDDRANPALLQGNGYLVLSSYLFPEKVGPGQFQPVVRYQDLERTDGGADVRRTEGGLNYIIKGHNARLSLIYATTHTEGAGTTDSVVLGAQYQF